METSSRVMFYSARVLYLGTFDACGLIQYVPSLVESLLTPEAIEQFKAQMNTAEVQQVLSEHPEYAAKINELLEKLGTIDVNSLIVCSSTCHATWRWYNICLRWVGCDKEGSAELWVDGKLVCSSYGLNTASHGPANRVEFGLPLLYSCTATKVYVDNCVVKSYA
jgi:hypothetical protein